MEKSPPVFRGGASHRATMWTTLAGLALIALLATAAWSAWHRSDPPEPTAPATAAATPSATAAATTVPTDVPLSQTLEGLEGNPPGLYHYARTAEDLGHRAEAAEAYARYGAAVPEMADIAAMAEGTNRFALGDYPAALEAFTRARDGAGDANTAYWGALRRGNALLRLGSPDDAIAAYQDAYARTEDDEQRAQALAGLIAAFDDTGRPDDMVATRRRLVRELPGTSLAAAALGKLTVAGIAVAPAEEAAVRAGNGDTAAAIALMETAIAADPTPPVRWSLDLAGWHAAAGAHDVAIRTVDALLARSGDDPLAPDAAWLKAQSLVKLGRDRDAAEAYLQIADRWPSSTRAADALWQRAWLVEDIDGLGAASEAFEALAVRYPTATNAREARFRSGLAAWRAGELPRAAERWTAVAENGDGPDRARAEYWLGKAAADTGAVDIATAHWRAAADADPTGYYGLRAAERLGEGRTSSPAGGTSTDGDRGAVEGARGDDGDGGADFDVEVPAWISRWRPGVTADVWARARTAVAARMDVRRGIAWLAVGESGAARRAWRAANAAVWGDPVAQALLAELAHRNGLHDIASSAASAVIATAPPSVRLGAPTALGHLAYPDAYGDLVRPASAANDIPPAVFFALIRQESRFDPTARSGAGATGLTQVMPTTGEGIAGMLGDAEFEVDNLFQPPDSIRYGATYLAVQLERFDGQAMPALAAYNAGPGNADRWWAASGGDPDLFAEIVDFRETRAYVRLTAENVMQYRRLYADMGGR